MAKQKKPVHRVEITEGKRNIIRQLLEEQTVSSKVRKKAPENEVKLLQAQWMHGLCRLWKQTSPRRIP